MFYDCKLPDGFTLGDKFDTSNVSSMWNMFSYCKLSKGFILGDKFATSNVTKMEEMFYECRYDNISVQEYFKANDINSIIALLK